MTMIDALETRGKTARMRAEQAKEAEAAKAKAERDSQLEAIARALMEQTGIDAETLKALRPEVDSWDGRYGVVCTIALRHLASEARIVVRCEKGQSADGRYTFGPTYRFEWPREYQVESDADALGLFAAAAREYYEKKRGEVIAELRDGSGNLVYHFHAKRYSVPDLLWNDPDVMEARAQLLLAMKPEWNTAEWAVRDWIRCAETMADKRVQAALVEARALVEKRQKYDDLRNALERLGREPVTDEDVEQAEAMVAGSEFGQDEAMQAALAKMRERSEQTGRLNDEERLLREAQAAAFYPFLVYEIGYAVMAESEDGERQAEVYSFFAVDEEPEEDGYWTPTRGPRMKPVNVVWTKVHKAAHLNDVPAGVLRYVATEWGTVKAPPAGATAI